MAIALTKGVRTSLLLALWSLKDIQTLTWNDRGTAMTLGYWGVGDVLGQSLSGVQPDQMECKTHSEIKEIF
jgi:hypothetical protein